MKFTTALLVLGSPLSLANPWDLSAGSSAGRNQVAHREIAVELSTHLSPARSSILLDKRSDICVSPSDCRNPFVLQVYLNTTNLDNNNNTAVELLGEGGLTLEDGCKSASRFLIEGGELYDYNTGYRVNTNQGVANAPFPNEPEAAGDIFTSFSLDTALIWSNGNFTSSQAHFCALSSTGLIYAVFTVKPPNCTPVKLVPSQCPDNPRSNFTTSSLPACPASTNLTISTPTPTANSTQSVSQANLAKVSATANLSQSVWFTTFKRYCSSSHRKLKASIQEDRFGPAQYAVHPELKIANIGRVDDPSKFFKRNSFTNMHWLTRKQQATSDLFCKMGSSFSSPQVNNAMIYSVDVFVFATSYAFAPTDTKDFGITGTLNQLFLGYDATETITPVLTVPPLAPAGTPATFTCNPLSSSITSTNIGDPVSGSILCPGAANTKFGAGTATLIFNVSPPGLYAQATFSFSVATPAPNQTITSHEKVRPPAQFVTRTLTACPMAPNSTEPTCTPTQTSMSLITSVTVLEELKVKRDNSSFDSHVYGPPDYTLSDGTAPPPRSKFVTQTGAPITDGLTPIVTVTVPDQKDFNYSTCSFWTFGVF